MWIILRDKHFTNERRVKRVLTHWVNHTLLPHLGEEAGKAANAVCSKMYTAFQDEEVAQKFVEVIICIPENLTFSVLGDSEPSQGLHEVEDEPVHVAEELKKVIVKTQKPVGYVNDFIRCQMWSNPETPTVRL